MKKIKSFNRTLFIRLIMASTVPILFMGLLGYILLSDRIDKNLQKEFKLVSKTIELRIREALREPLIILNQLSVFISATTSSKRMNDILDLEIRKTKYFEVIYLLDQDKRIISFAEHKVFRNKGENLIGMDMSGLNLNFSTYANSLHRWSQPFFSPFSGKQNIFLTVPVGDKTLVAGFSIEHLRAMIKTHLSDSDKVVLITDKNGQLIFHPNLNFVREQRNYSNVEIVSKAISGDYGINMFEMEGDSFIGSSSTISQNDWIVVVSQYKEKAFKPLFNLIAILITCFLIVVTFSLLWSRSVTKTLMYPLKQLQDQIKKISHGNYVVDMPLQVYSEMESMAGHFREMASTIKERENVIAISEERFRSIFNSITDAIVMVDSERTIIMVNPAFTRIFGYTADETLGKNSSFLYADPEMYKLQGELRYNKDVVIDKSVYEINFKRKDGTFFPTENSGVHVKKPNGELTGFLAVIRDITEKKKEHNQKIDMEKRLKQAQKMEAIGTLAGGIAHDFNNILSIIIGYTDILMFGFTTQSEEGQNLQNILDAGNRAKELVQQILSFSRQAQVEKIALKPQPIIRELMKMIRSSIPTTIEIKEDIVKDCGTVLADPTQLHQVLMNLCTNAFSAMENRVGTLSISLKVAKSVPPELEDFERLGKKFVELSVSDTGHGIDLNIIDKIFDPFFTTKDKGKGTGMGLATTYGIVKGCGGTITVESVPDIKTAFTIYLPQSDEDEKNDLSLEESPLEHGDERILFVDDEEILAEMGGRMLGKLGYDVTVKKSSIGALSTFLYDPNKYDLIITDQTMPEMTGLDMSKNMLQERPDIPIILCTGYSTMVNEEVAKSHGIKGFILKPVSMTSISKLIRKIIDGE
jgi:PAS domain S-box-containing protein